MEMNTISQGSNKGQSVFWDVIINALFALHSDYSHGVTCAVHTTPLWSSSRDNWGSTGCSDYKI